jgi:DNA-binding MarR family transcriptional regulator
MTTPLQAQEQRPTRAAPMSGADAVLDRVLQVFERGHHSATEMRVLLRLVDRRDAGIGELADQLGCRPTEITRAGRRLAMRGLVRTHRAGTPEQTLMEITPSGLASVQTLLTAARPARLSGPGRSATMGIDAHSPGGARGSRCTA